MIDIAKVRGHLGNLWGQTSMSDIGSKCELDKAITELERLQKREVPMKPQIFTQEKGFEIEICPSCKGSIHALKHWHEINGRGIHCDLCGQKLDWSDEK